MDDLQLGTIQSLLVERHIEEGFIVKHKDKQVILPEKEVTDKIEVGDSVDVFLYMDRQGNYAASMHHPEATLDSYGWAEVIEVVKNLGAFVNIGVEKEMLVSIDDLPLIDRVWPIAGDWLFVTLELDKNGKLLAKPIKEGDVIQDLEKAPATALHKPVTGRVYRANKAGSFILTAEGYRGFIHPSERKIEPRLGETIEGRIIDVKDNGTINVSLLPLKQEGMKEDAEVILEYLQNHHGEMPYNDKSDPEEIRRAFLISKAAFKRAIGKLMKEKKIIQKDEKTFLNSQEEQ